MCAACDDQDNPAAGPGYSVEEIIEAVRLVEREMPGEPAGEKMWAIFFGRENGYIDWTQFERMRLCQETALALLATRAYSVAPTDKYRLRHRPLRNSARSIGVCSA